MDEINTKTWNYYFGIGESVYLSDKFMHVADRRKFKDLIGIEGIVVACSGDIQGTLGTIYTHSIVFKDGSYLSGLAGNLPPYFIERYKGGYCSIIKKTIGRNVLLENNIRPPFNCVGEAGFNWNKFLDSFYKHFAHKVGQTGYCGLWKA
jgi:hypothetical protein